MGENLCLVCFSSEFRYDEELFRNICNICNTMQEVTGIGITVYENDANINFQRLKTITINKKRKLTLGERKQIKLNDTIPWELSELFKWIFEKQVESLKPYVVDWEEFVKLSQRIWEIYSNATGKNFDILKESVDSIKMKKYPIGWGSKYDPKTKKNMLAQVGKEFSKYKHDLVGSGSDSDIDYDKIDRNAKKVRIERMIHMKKKEKDEKIIGNVKDGIKENLPEEKMMMIKEENEEDEQIKNEKIELKMQDILNDDDNQCSLSSSDSESALSDEDEPTYVQLDYIEGKEKHKVRTLRKKKEHEVMWTGSFYSHSSRYMENNVALLFLAVYFSTNKTEQCCCLMDILKLIKTKTIPYIRMRRFIPSDLFFINDQSYHSFVLRDHPPSWNYMLVAFNKLMGDLRLNFLIKSDIDSLIRRMLKDLNLPSGFSRVIDSIRKDTHDINETKIGALKNSSIIRTNYRQMGSKYPYTILPEPFCLAHIFFAIKIVLKLDCSYEVRISDLVKELERSGTLESGKWFDWLDWWEEMYKDPSFSNCNSWENLERVQDSAAFLEGQDLEDNYEKFAEVGLEWNADLNHKGRIVGRKKNSHQDVLDSIEKPFRDIFNTFQDLFNEKPLLKDFTDSDIQYLLEPTKAKDSLFSDGIPASQGENDPCLVVEELSDVISKHNLTYERISYKEPDFADNIFDKNYACNTTEIEDDLLRILTFDTGISSKDVLHFVFQLEKFMLDRTKIKAKRRKRRN